MENFRKIMRLINESGKHRYHATLARSTTVYFAPKKPNHDLLKRTAERLQAWLEIRENIYSEGLFSHINGDSLSRGRAAIMSHNKLQLLQIIPSAF